MDNIELSRYRLARAEETLIVAKELYGKLQVEFEQP